MSVPRDVTYREKFWNDLRYIRSRILGLDLRLLLRSVWLSLTARWPEVGREDER